MAPHWPGTLMGDRRAFLGPSPGSLSWELRALSGQSRVPGGSRRTWGRLQAAGGRHLLSTCLVGCLAASLGPGVESAAPAGNS